MRAFVHWLTGSLAGLQSHCHCKSNIVIEVHLCDSLRWSWPTVTEMHYPGHSFTSFDPSFLFSFTRLLYSVLPPSVANELRHQRPVPAKKYECVTLLFSGVVGFNDYCAKNSDSTGAMKIVKLLNNLYTTFDVLTDPVKNPNVYKVCH